MCVRFAGWACKSGFTWRGEVCWLQSTGWSLLGGRGRLSWGLSGFVGWDLLGCLAIYDLLDGVSLVKFAGRGFAGSGLHGQWSGLHSKVY